MRVPLYAKILGWFLLNLALLGAGLLFFIQAHFGFGLDALISGRAGDQVETASRLILEDLRGRPPEAWGDVLRRYDRAYGVTFSLFGPGGEWRAGGRAGIPPAVRAEIERSPRQPRPGSRPPPPGERRPPPPRSLIHTENPRRYWALLRVELPLPPPAAGLLLIESASLSAGGLFFDARPWLLLALGGAAFSALFWLPFARRITRTIAQMAEATGRFAEGDFSRRVPVRTADEIGVLAAAVNRMAARLDGYVTGQRRFLGDIAHELCAPLARLQVALGILEERAAGEPRERLLDLREELDQMSALVNELMSFSKASLGASTTKVRAVNLRLVAERAVQREAAGAANVAVEVPDELLVRADPDLLERALANLLRNAVRHAGADGPIVVQGLRDAGSGLVRVRDEGPGVPPGMVGQLFDPFFRVDSARTRETGGVGLGLAIVKTCVESCGGTVSCRNLSPRGFEVTIRLGA